MTALKEFDMDKIGPTDPLLFPKIPSDHSKNNRLISTVFQVCFFAVYPKKYPRKDFVLAG